MENIDTPIINSLTKFIENTFYGRRLLKDRKIDIGLDKDTYENFTIRFNQECRIHLENAGITILTEIHKEASMSMHLPELGKISFYQIKN